MQDDRGGLVGHLEDADHTRCGAHLVEVFLRGLLGLGRALAEHTDRLLLLEGILDEAQRALATHRHGQHDAREEHHVAQREDGQNGFDGAIKQNLLIAIKVSDERNGVLGVHGVGGVEI